ncbi:GerAB/ArcD/ProY family transporter, partial [Bacillus sp. JJ664]
DIHFGRIFPIGENGVKLILTGSYTAFLKMLGFEIFLFLSLDFQDTKKKLLTLTFVNLCSTIIFTFVVFTSYVTLSNSQNNKLLNPLVIIFKTFQSKMVENVDTIFICLWSIVVCSTLISYFYIVSKAVHKSLNSIVKKRSSILLAILLLLMAVYPLLPLEIINVETVFKIGEHLDLVFVVIIPCLLFLINKVRGLLN